MSAAKRRLRNLLVFPGSQLRHGLVFLSITSFVHLALTAAAIILIDAWISGKEVIGHVPFPIVLAAMVVIYILYLGFAFLFGLYISHRWLGPLVAIERQLESLVEGRPVRQLKLRENDEAQLLNIANLINRLGAKLGIDPAKRA